MKRQSFLIAGLFFLLVGLLSFTLIPTPPPLKYKKVKGIKITQSAYKKIQKHKLVPACIQLTKDRKVTATKGYKLMVSADKRHFAVIPESQSQPSTSFGKGIEGKKIEGIGVLWCHCGGGSGDNCGFEDKPDKWGYTRLTCEGSCSCGMEITKGGPPTIVDDIYP